MIRVSAKPTVSTLITEDLTDPMASKIPYSSSRPINICLNPRLGKNVCRRSGA